MPHAPKSKDRETPGNSGALTHDIGCLAFVCLGLIIPEKYVKKICK